MKKIAILLVAVSLAGCGNSEPLSDSKPAPAAATAAAPVYPAAAAPSAASLDPALAARQQAERLLTDEKLGRYAIFQREMLPSNKMALGAAFSAATSGAGTAKDMEKAMSRDERLQYLEAAQNRALARAGLSEPDMRGIAGLITPYITFAMLAADAREELAGIERKSGGAAPDGMAAIKADILRETIGEFDLQRAEFAAQHGPKTIAALDRHEEELVALSKAMLESMGL